MPRLIQFMHPGGEPPAPTTPLKPWNRDDHCRSLLRLPGAFCRSADGRPEECAGLLFWGEWEAPARIVGAGATEFAERIYQPVAPQFPGGVGLQNTDPFVFDGPFLYSCCKQVRRDGTATYLRDLERGDVLLFGSRVNDHFVLDTVFVVSTRTTYSASRGAQALTDLVPATFVEATLKPLAQGVSGSTAPNEHACGPHAWDEADERFSCRSPQGTTSTTYALYEGATPENPIDGMFSFAPAVAYADSPDGFHRPALPFDFIKSGMTAGFRNCELENLTVVEAWRQAANHVRGQGLQLGTRFALPESVAG